MAIVVKTRILVQKPTKKECKGKKNYNRYKELINLANTAGSQGLQRQRPEHKTIPFLVSKKHVWCLWQCFLVFCNAMTVWGLQEKVSIFFKFHDDGLKFHGHLSFTFQSLLVL